MTRVVTQCNESQWVLCGYLAIAPTQVALYFVILFFWIFIWIFANKENFEIQDRIDRTAYKTRDRCKNHDSKENEVDQMMIYESLSFHIEHLSYNWSIITYWLLIENSIKVFNEVKHSTIVRSTV